MLNLQCSCKHVRVSPQWVVVGKLWDSVGRANPHVIPQLGVPTQGHSKAAIAFCLVVILLRINGK